MNVGIRNPESDPQYTGWALTTGRLVGRWPFTKLIIYVRQVRVLHTTSGVVLRYM